MDQEKFFETFGDHPLLESNSTEYCFTVEELYRAIKERLMSEVLCYIPTASKVGRLEERDLV
jgi:hypothetical protein